MSEVKCECCHAGALAKADLCYKTTSVFSPRLRLGRPATKYHYVYILVSTANPETHYVGRTKDIEARLAKHNKGNCPHTAKYRPWKIETSTAFSSLEKAVAFEKYQKSGSEREFSRRHF